MIKKNRRILCQTNKSKICCEVKKGLDPATTPAYDEQKINRF